MKAIQITQTGGPEVLTYSDAAEPVLGDDDVLVDVSVAGINYIDTYYREGTYHAQTPFTPGQEGAGTVAYDPKGEFSPGARVAWVQSLGTYAEQSAVPREKLVAVPESVNDEAAASMLLQGMTAHYLVNSVYNLSEGDSCLLTAGAGGVGQLVTQMAAAKGARVYSVVSSEAKKELAFEAGATEVFFYSDNLAEMVRRRNGGSGVDVVYDGVGRDTFGESLEAVRPRGLVCLFGAASGPVEPFDPQLLNTHGSIYLTRPSLGAYTATPEEYTERAEAVVQAVADGTISISVGNSYPLSEAMQAHTDLQERRTTGSSVLRVK